MTFPIGTKQEAIDLWNTRADEWISVEDGLPEKSGFVLAVKGKCIPRVAAYATRENVFEYAMGRMEVTHWQPLPEPPKNV